MFDRTFIIAEIGVNHNGSVDLAKELILSAKECGADAVKFQTFISSELATRESDMAEYQKENLKKEGSQLEMLKSLELSYEDHFELFDLCRKESIEFISSPFDLRSAEFLAELGVRKIKVGSGEITNLVLLNAIAKLNKTIILSSGMSTMGELENAVGAIALGFFSPEVNPTIRSVRNAFVGQIGRQELNQLLAILHCTSNYPAQPNELNLSAIRSISRQFGVTVGYSDHSEGSMAAIASVAFNAKILEKHLTLDRCMDGPDHKASIEPSEFKKYVSDVRQIEEALGDGYKRPLGNENLTANIARKSLVAKRGIKKGETFSEDNLTLKRPGTGIPAQYYCDYIGAVSNDNYEPDELIRDYDKFKEIK